jgi:hypothetical protein
MLTVPGLLYKLAMASTAVSMAVSIVVASEADVIELSNPASMVSACACAAARIAMQVRPDLTAKRPTNSRPGFIPADPSR